MNKLTLVSSVSLSVLLLSGCNKPVNTLGEYPDERTVKFEEIAKQIEKDEEIAKMKEIKKAQKVKEEERKERERIAAELKAKEEAERKERERLAEQERQVELARQQEQSKQVQQREQKQAVNNQVEQGGQRPSEWVCGQIEWAIENGQLDKSQGAVCE